MIKPFEARAVAFLDVLGFKSFVSEAENSAPALMRLVGLRTVVESHVRWDNQNLAPSVPPPVAPKYLFVSDSIILSSPLEYDKYDGLEIVVLKTTQIALKLMELGHLVRGGITVGSAWHDDRNIFGSAYVEAVDVEKRAVMPCVLLSDEAARRWHHPNRFAPNLCLRVGEQTVVDLLNTAYIASADIHGGVEQYFQQVKIFIENALVQFSQGTSQHEKWRWMARFFNDAVGRHGVGITRIRSI